MTTRSPPRGERLEGAAERAALFLVRGLPQHCAAEGHFSPSSLKALAEHLGILRELARRHPGVRPSLLPHIRDIRDFVTSALFHYFCLRNPGHFRLWGSLLSDVAFFFGDLSRSHSTFARSFPLEELIEGEAVDFRRLDAADVCARSAIRNDSVNRILNDAVVNNALLRRAYSIERFNTHFVYHITHFTFYASRWGRTSAPFTKHYYRNLDSAARWSRTVRDADLVAECVVSILHSGFEASCDDLIDFVLGRQIADGAILREPSLSDEEALTYERVRHTTLVGLWAISEYAHANAIELSIALQDIDRATYRPQLSASDRMELGWLEGFIANYAGVTAGDVSARERQGARRLSRRFDGLRPFRCREHYLKELEDSMPHVPGELSLPRALIKTLLEVVSGSFCTRCVSGLLDALDVLACASPRPEPSGERDSVRELIDGFRGLTIVRDAPRPL